MADGISRYSSYGLADTIAYGFVAVEFCIDTSDDVVVRHERRRTTDIRKVLRPRWHYQDIPVTIVY